MDTAKEIKSALKKGTVVMGSRTVLRGMKNRMLDSVIYASNCPDSLMKDLDHYSRISGVRVEGFGGNSVQLGEFCGKPFSVLIIGMKKDKNSKR